MEPLVAGPSTDVTGLVANGNVRRMRWDRARRVAGEAAAALPAESRTLADAAGRALAAPLTALTDLPAFDTSAMDGWAVAGPGPWTLREDDITVGRVPAALATGTAGRIATGAPVPPGAGAVLRLEDGLVDSGVLRAAVPLAAGRDIRPRGQECAAGTVLVEAGATVTPALLGLAAAAGHDGLLVHRRPSVHVLVTGDELLRSGIPADGLVRDALGPLLAPWLTAAGASLDGTTAVSDDPAALRSRLRDGGADVIITTGGTSVGPTDLLHRLITEAGSRFLVDSVAVRPGHPMLLAALPPAGGQSRWLVGLPGNPLAAVAGLVTLVLPLLRRLGGHRPPEPLCLPAAAPFPGHPADVCLVPAELSHGRLRPLPFDGPAMLRGVARADFLAVVPPGGVARDALAETIPLGG
jgi:molybdopterin molybdotransferase